MTIELESAKKNTETKKNPKKTAPQKTRSLAISYISMFMFHILYSGVFIIFYGYGILASRLGTYGIQLSLLTIFSLCIFLLVWFVIFVLAASLLYSNTRKLVY